MAQGDFTKEEAKSTREAVEELIDAIPKSKRMGYLGHLNDILLFIRGVERHIEAESTPLTVQPAEEV